MSRSLRGGGPTGGAGAAEYGAECVRIAGEDQSPGFVSVLNDRAGTGCLREGCGVGLWLGIHGCHRSKPTANADGLIA